MTIANQIKAFHTNQATADIDMPNLMSECEEKSITTDQDWDAESTTYTFADDSCIVVSGAHVSAYGCAQ